MTAGIWRYIQEQYGGTDARSTRSVQDPERASRYKRYLDEMHRGSTVQDVWDDIPPINAQAAERLGYPTQKPEALLERIIKASSNEGDVVLDPFCGCGTAVVAAQTSEAALDRHRHHPPRHRPDQDTPRRHLRRRIRGTYEVVGEPTDLAESRALANEDPYQFQCVGARPWSERVTPAKSREAPTAASTGASTSMRQHRQDASRSSSRSRPGRTSTSHYVRDLRGVIEREKAEIGVLITVEEPTRPMLKEAAEAGFFKFESAFDTGTYPRLQILTIEQLLGGAQVAYPRLLVDTFKRAPKAKSSSEQLTLNTQD